MTLDELKAKSVRKASRAVLGDFPPPDDPLASWFRRVRVALPGEMWPEWEGRPMMPLCQFNITELPFCPVNLADIAMITIFVAWLPKPGAPNGEEWLLRTYKSLDELVAVSEPKYEPEYEANVQPLPIRWEVIEEDYPAHINRIELAYPRDAVTGTYPKADRELDELWDASHLITSEGTKIGGWPFLCQGGLHWQLPGDPPQRPEFVFQIDSEYEAGWAWGDQGFGYFGRGFGEKRDEWVMDWQCY